jgi:hypothetical protein
MPKNKQSVFDKRKSDDEDISDGKDTEGDEHDETPEEIETEMHTGEKDADTYTEEGREELMEDDEVSEWEEGFAEGEEESEKAHCAACGKVLSQDKKKLIEREFDHVIFLFCSEKCASAGRQHGKKR